MFLMIKYIKKYRCVKKKKRVITLTLMYTECPFAYTSVLNTFHREKYGRKYNNFINFPVTKGLLNAT